MDVIKPEVKPIRPHLRPHLRPDGRRWTPRPDNMPRGLDRSALVSVSMELGVDVVDACVRLGQ